jgi:hypothetical protein
MKDAVVKRIIEREFNPTLVDACNKVITYTRHKWKVTSHIRDSPSHKRGVAIDIAPLIAPKSQHLYAVYSDSDPVLYKRARLIRDLQRLAMSETPLKDYDVGIFMEPDHLHLQVFAPENPGNPRFRVLKWGICKPVYPDSQERMELPLIT